MEKPRFAARPRRLLDAFASGVRSVHQACRSRRSQAVAVRAGRHVSGGRSSPHPANSRARGRSQEPTRPVPRAFLCLSSIHILDAGQDVARVTGRVSRSIRQPEKASHTASSASPSRLARVKQPDCCDNGDGGPCSVSFPSFVWESDASRLRC